MIKVDISILVQGSIEVKETKHPKLLSIRVYQAWRTRVWKSVSDSKVQISSIVDI